MTQNAALSLIAATVIAAGFLIGWCASAFELVPDRAKSITATGAGDRSPAPPPGNDARVRPSKVAASGRP
jgi:hypothetical protein